MDIEKYSYNGNTLVLGQTGGGKTTFAQYLEKSNISGKTKDFSWVTKIILSIKREHPVRSCFNVPVKFLYPQSVIEFNIVTENKIKSKKINQIIITFLDRFNDFGSFLTVAWKFNFTCV